MYIYIIIRICMSVNIHGMLFLRIVLMTSSFYRFPYSNGTGCVPSAKEQGNRRVKAWSRWTNARACVL